MTMKEIGYLGICGGRNFRFERMHIRMLDDFILGKGVQYVLHGDQHGADRSAHVWALCRGLHPVPFPPDFELYGIPNAYLKRNMEIAHILSEYPNSALIVFSGGSGTAHITKCAKRYGVDIYHAGECGIMKGVA